MEGKIMRNKSQAIRNRLAVRRNSEGQISRRTENIYARLRRILFRPKLLALPLLALALGPWNAPLLAGDLTVEAGGWKKIETETETDPYNYNNINITNGMLIVDNTNGKPEGLTVSNSTTVNWFSLDEHGNPMPSQYYDDPNDPDDDKRYRTGGLALGNGDHALNGVTTINGGVIALYGSETQDDGKTNKTEINGKIELKESELKESMSMFLIGDNVDAIINADITIDSGTWFQAKVKELEVAENTNVIIPDYLKDQGEYYHQYSTNNSVVYDGNIDVKNKGRFVSSGKFNGSSISITGAGKDGGYMELREGSIIGSGSGITLDVNDMGYSDEDGKRHYIGFLATDIKEYNNAKINISESKAMFQNTQEKDDVSSIYDRYETFSNDVKKLKTSPITQEEYEKEYEKARDDYFAYLTGLADKKTVYNKDSKIIITNGSTVFANVSAIRTTPITIDSESTLYITNAGINDDGSASGESSLSDPTDNYAFGTTKIYTYDKEGKPTALVQNDTRNQALALKKAGYYLDSFSGNGNITIISIGDKEEEKKNRPTYVALSKDSTGFEGTFTVETGLFHLVCSDDGSTEDDDGSTEFGKKAENSCFTLKGIRSKKENDNYLVESGSTLYFDRNFRVDADVAPTLTFNTVNFEDGLEKEEDGDQYVYGGSTLFFDTSMATKIDEKGFAEDYNLTDARKLGIVNADTITIGDKTNIWYDMVSILDPVATMTVELNAKNIYVGTTKVGEQEEEESETGLDKLNEIFKKPLINATTTANTDSADPENKVVSYTVNLNVKNVTDFAEAEEMSDEAKKYAAEIDENRKMWGDKETPTVLYDAMYNENDPDVIKKTIQNLARSWGLDNALDLRGRIGMAGSAFFSGLTAGGVVTRYQSRFDNEDREAASALENVKNENANTTSQTAGNSSSSKNRSLWGAFSYTSVESDQYVKGGITYDSYKTTRSGVLTGLKRQFDDTTSGGILFSYTQPESTQGGLYEFDDDVSSGYQTKINMDDFQFALHFEKVIGDAWELSLFAGGGAQTLDWERTVLDNGKLFSFNGDSTGNTVTATAYLARRIDLSEHFVIRPTIGIDSEHSWLFGFEENAIGDHGIASDNMIVMSQRYIYDTIQYSRNSGRLGLTTTWSGPRERGGLVGRIFYGVQLGGDDAAFITMKSTSEARQPWEITQEGHTMGGESLNLGMGGYLFLNRDKTLTLNGDYNVLMYKNATSQNATGTVSYRF